MDKERVLYRVVGNDHSMLVGSIQPGDTIKIEVGPVTDGDLVMAVVEGNPMIRRYDHQGHLVALVGDRVDDDDTWFFMSHDLAGVIGKVEVVSRPAQAEPFDQCALARLVGSAKAAAPEMRTMFFEGLGKVSVPLSTGIQEDASPATK